MKRMVVISDMHCGHLVGLTPPRWHYQNDGKLYKNQKELWRFYTETIDSLKPIDILVVNGDAIDGKGYRAGGADQKTTDRLEQVEMAVECIEYAQAKTVRMTYGTPYHTGSEEDWESIIADRVGAKIEGHAFFDIDGVVFDIKHKVGGSSIPHGRNTALLREKLWNTMWSERDQQRRADVLIRSHVHYHTFGGTHVGITMTTPALQGFGSKYGVRQCSGIVDIGMIYFDIDKEGFAWNSVIAKLAQQKAPVEVL